MKKFIIFFILFVMFLPCVNASEICKQELERIAPNGVLKLNAVKPISNDYADVLWALGIKYDEDIISNIELRECNNSFDECYLYFYLNNGNSEVVSDSNYEQYKVNVQWAESNPKIQDFITDYVKKLEDYSKNHTGNYDIGGPNTAGYELDDINNLKYWTHNPNFYNDSASTFGFNNIYEYAFEYIPKFKDSFSNYNINIKFHGGSAGIKGKFLAHEMSAFSLWYKDVLYFASSTNYESDGYYVKNIAIAANDILYVPDDTESTPEALLAAVKKRIETELLGYDFKIEIGGKVCDLLYHEDSDDCSFLDNEVLEDDDELYFLRGYSSRDIKYFNITYNGITKPYLVVRDSSKMKTNFNKVSQDFDTGIKVETTASDVPDDMKVKVNVVENNTDEYNKIKEKINTEFEAYDVSLFSNSLGNNITNTSSGKFKVYIPIPDKLKGKKLAVYYINDKGEIEKFSFNIADDIGFFETNHFSTYILAEVIDEEISNSEVTENVPNTLDNCSIYFIASVISLIGIIVNLIYLKFMLNN